MRAVASRIAAFLFAAMAVSAGVLMSFAFFSYAVFAYFTTFLSPALSAFATAFLFLVAAFGAAAAFKAWGRTRKPARGLAAGEALGSLFAGELKSFAAKNPGASLLVSLAAGFLVGARARSGGAQPPFRD